MTSKISCIKRQINCTKPKRKLRPKFLVIAIKLNGLIDTRTASNFPEAYQILVDTRKIVESGTKVFLYERIKEKGKRNWDYHMLEVVQISISEALPSASNLLTC